MSPKQPYETGDAMGLVAEGHVPLSEDEMLWQIRGLLSFCTSEAAIATDQAVAVNLGGGNGPFCKIDTPIRELAEWARKGIYAERMKREQSNGPADSAARELANIVNAERFNRERFRDDTEFADWAQSRAKHTLARSQPEAGKDSPQGDKA